MSEQKGTWLNRCKNDKNDKEKVDVLLGKTKLVQVFDIL